MRKTLPALIAATLCVSGCTTGVGGDPFGGLLGGIIGGNGYNERNLSDFERAAVNACGQEAERYTRDRVRVCLLYTSPSPRDRQKSRMPSSA